MLGLLETYDVKNGKGVGGGCEGGGRGGWTDIVHRNTSSDSRVNPEHCTTK